MNQAMKSYPFRIQSPMIHYQRCNFSTTETTANDDQDIVTINFLTQNGSIVETKSEIGKSVLEICLDYELDHDGECGGEGMCSKCHVCLPKDLFDTLTPPNDQELDMLDLGIGVTKTSRLACQIIIDKSFEGQTIELPPPEERCFKNF